jgi:hypothetical protein
MTYPPPSDPPPPEDPTLPAPPGPYPPTPAFPADPDGPPTAPIAGAAYPMPATRQFEPPPNSGAPSSGAPGYGPPGSGPPGSGPPGSSAPGYEPPSYDPAGYPPPAGAMPGYPPPGATPPGYAPPPYGPPGSAPPGYGPPGATPPGYGPPGATPPGYGPPGGAGPMYPQQQPGYPMPFAPPKPPRKRNGPLIALVVVIGLLLCGGTVTAGVLAVNAAVDKTKEVVDENLPDIPEIPALPTDLPTDAPYNGDGREIAVVYEVTGDGPADLTYVEHGSQTPKQIKDAQLPWKLETKLNAPALVSITAFRSGSNAGALSCRATVDGNEVSAREASGTFAIVSCTEFQID